MHVYFCDPRSPWQRGSNENTNRLLRQYLAESVELRRFTAADLAVIADRIDTRPRRVLDWASSADAFLPHLTRQPRAVGAIRQPLVDRSALERR